MKQLLIALCMFPLYVLAQTTNTHIKATIKGMNAGEIIYLKDSRFKAIDSTISVANGFEFNFNIAAGEGSLYSLQIGRLLGFNDKMLDLYLDKGTVLIQGNGPYLKDARLTGPSFIKDLNDYHQYTRQNTTAMFVTGQQLLVARQNNDSIGVRKLSMQQRAEDSVYRQLTNQWIATHRSSPISVFLLSTRYFYNRIESREVLFKKLLPAAIDNALGKQMKEQVLINDLNGIGKTAPALTLADTSGKPVALHDLKGKYVLLDFWASWCHPCREETPFLKKAIKQYGDRNFTIVSVSIDTDTAKWLQAVRKDEMEWTNLIDPSINRSNGILHGYYVATVPTNLLIDPDGKILARNLRGEEVARKLEQVLTNKQ